MRLPFDRVVDLAWAPRSPRLALLARQQLIVVSAPDFVPLTAASIPDGHGLAWSPREDALAVSTNRGVLTVVELDGRRRWTADAATDGYDPCWSPSGELLAATGDGVTLRDSRDGHTRWRHLRRTATEHQTLEASTGRVSVSFGEAVVAPDDVTWAHDSTLLAVQWQHDYRVLEVQSGEVVADAPLPQPAHLKGRRLAWSDRGDALFEKRGNRLAQWSFAIDAPSVDAPVFSRDGAAVAAEGADHRLHVSRHGEVVLLAGHPRTIEGLCWLRDGELATSCRDGLVRLLARGSSAFEVLESAESGHLCASSDGHWLAVWGLRDAVVTVLPTGRSAPAPGG